MKQRSESLAKLFKVLMHPARLEILEILRHGEECVCHMEAHLGYRQAHISQHLMVLREAGLVEVRRDGWNVFYRVTQPQVFDLIDRARVMVGEPVAPVLPVTQHSRSLTCPCPKCTSARTSLLMPDSSSVDST
jgi:DNA-binding transcriptional ArsR family regulator